jgi:molybdenum cofactor cytidylyltransferase
MFCPSDQPFLRPDTLKELLRMHVEDPDCICRPCLQESTDVPPVPGTPVLFGKRYFPELLSLPDGKGGGFLAKKYPEQVRYLPVRDSYELMDIDTPEDLLRLSHHSQNS